MTPLARVVAYATSGVAPKDIFIAPVSADRLALAALGTFIGWLSEFRAEDVIHAELLGVLRTMTTKGSRLPQAGLLMSQASGEPCEAPDGPGCEAASRDPQR